MDVRRGIVSIPLKIMMVIGSEDFHTKLLKEHENYRYQETQEELKKKIEEILKGKGKRGEG